MDHAEPDVLAPLHAPRPSTAPSCTAPIRWSDWNERSSVALEVVGIFPNEAAITWLIGAILLEQNDEWAVQRACHITPVCTPLTGDVYLHRQKPAEAARIIDCFHARSFS